RSGDRGRVSIASAPTPVQAKTESGRLTLRLPRLNLQWMAPPSPPPPPPPPPAPPSPTPPPPPVSRPPATARPAPLCRAPIAARRSALSRDPCAPGAGGEKGEAIVGRMNRGGRGGGGMIARRAVCDEIIGAQFRAGADQVENPAAGLEARPWRMKPPADLRWV